MAQIFYQAGHHVVSLFTLPYVLFPGVPVFFILSGFLVTGSYLSRPAMHGYLRSRFLRIWPPLAVSTLITTVLLKLSGYFSLKWILGQFSILFIYRTPTSIRGFSGAMPNGILWTLPVEVGFYLLVPLLLVAYTRRKMSLHQTAGLVCGFMGLAFLLVASHNLGFHHHPNLSHGPLHHFWFFGLGMLARLYWLHVKPWVENQLVVWSLLHLLGVSMILWLCRSADLGNLLNDQLSNFLLTLTLPSLVLAMAFTGKNAAARWLRGHDVSYGVYLVHIPYLWFVWNAGARNTTGACMVLLLTTGTALIMWALIESPLLALKQRLAAPR